MKPLDYRNEQWNDVQARLHERLLAVLSAWRQHGPGTTREIAEKSGIDLLSLRPRTTDLYQLGFITLVEGQEQEVNFGHATQNKREGIYRALSDGEAFELFHNRKREAADAQLALKI